MWSPLLNTHSWYVQQYSSIQVSVSSSVISSPLFAGPLPTSTSCPATPGEALPDWSSLFQIRRMRDMMMMMMEEMMMMEGEMVIWVFRIVEAKYQKFTPDDNKPWIYFGQKMAITIFHNCFYNSINILNDLSFENAEIELIIYFQPASWWLQSWLLLLTRHSPHIALAKLVLPIQFEAQLYHNII